MDLHGEKEEMTKPQESASAAVQREAEETAAAEGEDTSVESMDQREEDGHKADESTGLLDDDVGGSEEASAPPPVAHPWSLLRAFAGCLGLLGCCGDTKQPPAAVAGATEPATGAAAAARSSQEEEAAGEKAKANGMEYNLLLKKLGEEVQESAPDADVASKFRAAFGGKLTYRKKQVMQTLLKGDFDLTAMDLVLTGLEGELAHS